jgi:predicted DNA-binding transcriptional regulator YafY
VDAAARLLRLLSLLQVQPVWRGADLAARMEVTPRTVRRDVVRLRALGYPIDATTGTDGGYRLGTGGRLPPLLLDDDEAVAVAVGLRVAATTTVAGVGPTAVAALSKLEQVMPARLRERVAALQSSTTALGGGELPQIDAEVLVVLATGCRRSEIVQFGYRSHAGAPSERRVEPLQIVHTGRRWYFVARDLDHGEWRTFRVDRVFDPVLTGHRVDIIDPPDAAALVSEGTTIAPYAIEARIELYVPPEVATRVVPPTLGVTEPIDEVTTLLRIGADALDNLAFHALGLPCRFEVLDPPELRARVRELAARISRAHS